MCGGDRSDMDYIHKLKDVLPQSIHPHLGAVRRKLRSLPARTHRQKQRLLEDPAIEVQDRQLLQQVESRISPGDGMYTGDGAHYFKVGLSAIHCIEEAIHTARLASVSQILDLPCGHGRVLRFLVRHFPKASFTASDLDRKGVDFCERMFGVNAIYSKPDLDQLSLGRQFDLIWCGSLITHLDAVGIRALLACFTRHLSLEGLVVFTAHGERVIQRMLDRNFEYGIPAGSVAPLIGAYRRDGFGFAPYPGEKEYGVSLTAPEWIRGETEKLGLRAVYSRPRGWDNHQDVYAFVRL